MDAQNENQLKKSAFSGTIWKFMERVCAQLVSLVVSIVLARILIPEDYAPISIVSIFFAFCYVFIAGGLSTSLIQKKDVTDEDYSTVLVMNLIMAAILYALMYLFAPMIAQLYQKPQLIRVIRVMALCFFVNGLKSVLSAYTSSNFQFRKFFFSTIIGTVISAVVGILMAMKGFGVWALVAQEMTNAVIDTGVLYLTTKLRFKRKFSVACMKYHINYGWKIMTTSIISTIYEQLNPLIVGVRFAPVDLAYYNKGNSFPMLINATVSDTLASVLFPVMSKVQDNKEDVLNITRRYVKVSSYLLFPVMAGMFAVAETFVEVLLTEKWLPAVPYIQIFAFSYMFNMIQVGNIQAIKAIGRSDIVLTTEILKKSLYFAVIAAFVFLSDNAVMLALSSIVCTMIALMINTYPTRKLIGYNYRYQLEDFLPNLLIAGIMAAVVLVVGTLSLNNLLLLIVQIATGVVVYVALSIITRNENFRYLLDFILQIIQRR